MQPSEAVRPGRPARPFILVGTVEHGDQRGRTLGFATANLPLQRTPETPAEGVYAGVAVTVDGGVHRAAVSVGRRPTFYDEGFELVEAHLLDFDDDLYDQVLEVRLHERIRGQVKFDGVDKLVAQLEADVRRTRKLITDDLLVA